MILFLSLKDVDKRTLYIMQKSMLQVIATNTMPRTLGGRNNSKVQVNSMKLYCKVIIKLKSKVNDLSLKVCESRYEMAYKYLKASLSSSVMLCQVNVTESDHNRMDEDATLRVRIQDIFNKDAKCDVCIIQT